MDVTVGRDWKLRNERGEVIGELVPPLTFVIDPRIGGGAEGGRGTGGGPPSLEEGKMQTPQQGRPDVQESLLGPSELGARARGGAEHKAETVWAHYVDTMNPRHKALDADTRKIIAAALKVASVGECCQAISGCAKSDFHMGRNDRGRKYNQITQILKGKRGSATARERIDFFIDLAEKSGVQSGVPSASNARIQSAKQDVRDAHEMPGDEHVARRGKESEEYLTDQGWTITRDDTGWPTFHPPT